MEYIKDTISAPESDCFLCEALTHDDDRERLLLNRRDLTFVIMNLYPYNNGHLLVAPNRHIGELDEMTYDEMTNLFDHVRKAVNWLKAAIQPHGFNIGINLGRVAGAGLSEHLHIHIVPRWNGDTNSMPVLGGVKVISQGLQSTYDELFKVIED